jgi:hypothetical protein
VGLNDFGETLFRFDGPAIGLKWAKDVCEQPFCSDPNREMDRPQIFHHHSENLLKVSEQSSRALISCHKFYQPSLEPTEILFQSRRNQITLQLQTVVKWTDNHSSISIFNSSLIEPSFISKPRNFRFVISDFMFPWLIMTLSSPDRQNSDPLLSSFKHWRWLEIR